MTFPLPVRWRATLPSFCVVWEPPVPDGDQVVARCGEALVAFGADSGEVRWRAELGRRTGDGTCLVRAGDLFVTDVVRRPERLTTLVAVGRDGTVAWRADLPAQVLRGGVASAGHELTVLGREPGAGPVRYRLDARTGVVTSHSPSPTDPVTGLVAAGGLLVTLTRGAVRAHDPETRDVRWSVPVSGQVFALDGDAVFVVAGQDLVSLDLDSGAERWRSGPLPEDAGRLAAAGGIVLYGHLRGNGFYRADDGTLLGETADSYGAPAADRGRIYLGGRQTVLCASLSS